jgi:hypothetical protein
VPAVPAVWLEISKTVGKCTQPGLRNVPAPFVQFSMAGRRRRVDFCPKNREKSYVAAALRR